MKELEGPELAVAVARVMGYPAVIDGAICSVRRERQYNVRRPFTPHLGGGAAWEVHEWAAARHNVVTVTYEGDGEAGRVCMLTHAMSFTGPAIGRGPTDAIALCRAVVALGNA